MAGRDGKRCLRGSRRGFSWFYLAIAVLVGGFCYSFYNQQVYLNGVNEKYRVAEQRLADAKKINIGLREEKAGLEDLRRVEKVAREQLNMVYPGEMPYILPHGSK